MASKRPDVKMHSSWPPLIDWIIDSADAGHLAAVSAAVYAPPTVQVSRVSFRGRLKLLFRHGCTTDKASGAARLKPLLCAVCAMFCSLISISLRRTLSVSVHESLDSYLLPFLIRGLVQKG